MSAPRSSLDSPPRALHIDTGREMHGGQWQVLYLLDGLKNAKLLATKGSPLLREAGKRGIDAYPFSMSALQSMARGSDLLHAHDARAHTVAAIAGGGKPLVVSRRVAYPIKRGFFSSWKYAQPSLYLAVSKFVTGCLTDAGIRGAKIRVVHDGVPIPPEAARPIPERVIALRSKWIDVPGLDIQFADNLWEDLATAAVFVYASEIEGLGSAVLAAMASGVPVVACGAGGLQEAIENGNTGLLVERQDVAEAVRGLLARPEQAHAMGLKGRARAVDRFSVETMRAATIQAYKEVLS